MSLLDNSNGTKRNVCYFINMKILSNVLLIQRTFVRRYASTKKYEGIKVKLSEDQAREYFDQWLKSLW